jgi:hypothetical protein
MSQPFDWDAGLVALKGWVSGVVGLSTPILIGEAARQSYKGGLAVVLDWIGAPTGDGGSLEASLLSAAPEPSPPAGSEFIETTQQQWVCALSVSVLNDPDTVMTSQGPLAVLLRLLTAMRGEQVNAGLVAAGLGEQGFDQMPTSAPPRVNAQDYQPEAVAHVRFQILEQSDTRIGYLTGATFAGTVNGNSFPITTP